MKMRYYLLLILLFISTNVLALDFCDYTDAYKDYMNLSEEERSKVVAPIMCKDFEEQVLRDNEINDFKSVLKGSVSDSRYSSVDDGLVTPPKNQYYEGLCWDFAATGNVETLALKNGLGTYDLSEAHMAYSLLAHLYSDAAGKMGKYNSSELGGQVYFSAAYYFNNKGMLTENEWKYKYPKLDIINSSNYIQGRDILTVDKFVVDNVNTPKACGSSEISNIKQKIITDGSVQATVYMDEDLLTNGYYYLSTSANSQYANHGVLIVGWDDTISKSMFNGATRDGAWIAKNSWGSTWGNNGYYYISYQDNFVCNNMSYYEGISTTNYDNTYNTSSLVGSNYPYDPHIYVASKFEKKNAGKEQIKKISFAIPYAGTYKIYLSTASNYQDTSTWEQVGQGSNGASYGIDSIYIDKVVDDDFYIIIEYKSNQLASLYMLSTCSNDEDVALYTTFETGKSYISNNQVDWTDMANKSVKCKPNIYVYTDTYVDDTLDIVLTNITNNNNQVSINYTSTNNPNYTYKIMKGNEDVTDHFEVNTTSNKFNLLPDNTISGTFRFIINIGDDSTYVSFKLDEVITAKTSDVLIKDDLIYVDIPSNTNIYADQLADKLDINNTSVRIVNEVNNTIDKLYTGLRFVTSTTEYRIIIRGDANGDSKVSALDYIAVRKNILGTSNISDPYYFKAADMNKDNKISALDYIAIRKKMLGD
jgi:C1A family cysteine protease